MADTNLATLQGTSAVCLYLVLQGQSIQPAPQDLNSHFKTSKIKLVEQNGKFQLERAVITLSY